MPRTKKTTTKNVKKKPSQSEIEFPPDPDELAFNKQMASIPIDKFDELWPPEEIDIFFPPDDDEKRMARWMAEEARKDQEMMRSLARDFPDVDLSSIPEFDDLDLTSLNDDYDRKMNRKRRSEKEE